jgi:hypothetical protein
MILTLLHLKRTLRFIVLLPDDETIIIAHLPLACRGVKTTTTFSVIFFIIAPGSLLVNPQNAIPASGNRENT